MDNYTHTHTHIYTKYVYSCIYVVTVTIQINHCELSIYHGNNNNINKQTKLVNDRKPLNC